MITAYGEAMKTPPGVAVGFFCGTNPEGEPCLLDGQRAYTPAELNARTKLGPHFAALIAIRDIAAWKLDVLDKGYTPEDWRGEDT